MKRGERLEAGEAVHVAELAYLGHPLIVADCRANEKGLSPRVFLDATSSDRYYLPTTIREEP
jgi:hypothetical protein